MTQAESECRHHAVDALQSSRERLQSLRLSGPCFEVEINAQQDGISISSGCQAIGADVCPIEASRETKD